MLKRILKITGIIVGLLVVVVVGFYTKAYFSVEGRRSTHYKVLSQALPIKTDSATLAHGARLIKAKGCTDCHSADLGGKVFIDDAPLGHIVAPNLTKGKGGLPADHSSEDW